MQFSIQQARRHAGLTQQEMAEQLSIGKSTYIKIEKDPERATVRQVNQISAITGIPVESIFFAPQPNFSLGAENKSDRTA